MVSWDDIEPHTHCTHLHKIDSIDKYHPSIHTQRRTHSRTIASQSKAIERSSRYERGSGSLQSTSFPTNTMQALSRYAAQGNERRECPGTKCAVSLLHKYFVNVYTRPIQTKAFNAWFIYSFLLVCFLTSALSPSHTLAFDALLLFYERTPKENKNK